MNLKAEAESMSPHFCCRRLVSGAFNLGFMGSTCSTLPVGSERAMLTISARSLCSRSAAGAGEKRRNLKPKLESGSSYFSFKRLLPGAFNTGFDTGNMHRPTGGLPPRVAASMSGAAASRSVNSAATVAIDSTSIVLSSSVVPGGAAVGQGLTLVHVRAQLEELQDTFMSYVGSYGGQQSSS